MAYIDGMVASVPTDKKDEFAAYSRDINAIFREYGAVETVDAWGSDVPVGKVTDFFRAVAAVEGETVVFSWVKWADKASRDAAWEKIMGDERLNATAMPFDGKRMIYGGFEVMS